MKKEKDFSISKQRKTIDNIKKIEGAMSFSV